MKNKKLVVFIHGLSGSAKKWNNFSKLIESDGELNQLFDADFYEFPTSWFRLPFFRATPPIQSLAHGLSTDLENRFPDYPEIALICHSLGGLVGRHYLLSRLKNQQKLRISKLLLYATPNNGADLARVGKCLSWRHYQLRQLCRDSDFLDFLNTDWADLKVEEKFAVKYVIGLLDKLVDPTSARAHWGSSHFETIADKGHFNIVPPENCKALSFQIAKRFLLYHESPVAPNSPLWKHSLALIIRGSDKNPWWREVPIKEIIGEQDEEKPIDFSKPVLVHGPPNVGKTCWAIRQAYYWMQQQSGFSTALLVNVNRDKPDLLARLERELPIEAPILFLIDDIHLAQADLKIWIDSIEAIKVRRTNPVDTIWISRDPSLADRLKVKPYPFTVNRVIKLYTRVLKNYEPWQHAIAAFETGLDPRIAREAIPETPPMVEGYNREHEFAKWLNRQVQRYSSYLLK